MPKTQLSQYTVFEEADLYGLKVRILVGSIFGSEQLEQENYQCKETKQSYY